MATVLALSALSGRGTVAMWGYPLWLFLGLWIVLTARRVLDESRLARVRAHLGGVFAGLALAFIANYAVLPQLRSSLPRGVLSRRRARPRTVATLSRRRPAQPIVYVIGSMWDGGNVAHYAPDHPRVLIDGKPERAPWIDLADLRRTARWWSGPTGDLNAMPPGSARHRRPMPQVQPPFCCCALPAAGDPQVARMVGWAIRCAPRPSLCGAATTLSQRLDDACRPCRRSRRSGFRSRSAAASPRAYRRRRGT